MRDVNRYFTRVALPGKEPVHGFVPLWEEPFVSPMFSFDVAKKVLENATLKSWKYDDDADVFVLTYEDGTEERVEGQDVEGEYWMYSIGSEWPWKEVRK